MRHISTISFALGTLAFACGEGGDSTGRPPGPTSASSTSGAGGAASAGAGGATNGSSSSTSASGTSTSSTSGTSTSSTSTSTGSSGAGGASGSGGSGGRGGRGGGGQGGGDAGTDASAGKPDGGSNGLGPTGGACPGGPYGSPLPANAQATVVRSGLGMLEGPLWVASQNALFVCEFTDTVTSGRIHKYTPADGNIVTFVDNVGVAGLALDRDGKIIAASHDRQRLTRFDPVTAARTDVQGGDLYMGQPFNQVNDVVIRGDGNMYFTDPDYQRKGRPGQDATAFYRLSPAGVVTRLGTSRQPNGIALSPDGNTLYVAGSTPAQRFALGADGAVVGAPAPFYSSGSDGMAVDCAGNVYLSTNGGVTVVSPSGQALGTIAGITEGGTTNSAFGGSDRQTLYITTMESLYQIHLNVPGFPN